MPSTLALLAAGSYSLLLRVNAPIANLCGQSPRNEVKQYMLTYYKKEFLTDAPEPSTSSVVSFSGLVQWGKNEKPEPLSFLEISNCHEKARLHRTYQMTAQQWIDQVTRLRDHVNTYLDFLTESQDTR